MNQVVGLVMLIPVRASHLIPDTYMCIKLIFSEHKHKLIIDSSSFSKILDLKQMGLQVDDVFRMVEMTVFLCILLPISVRWFASKWHAGIHLHRLINLVYFVDIVRRHSHPHSWILNTPVFVLYLFDKHVFTYFYKRNKSPEMKRIKLGQDFMVLYWKSPYGFTDTIGPDYSMLLNDSSFFEQKHVFTCFENRSGRVLEDDGEDEEETGVDKYENEAVDDNDWTVGVVIRGKKVFCYHHDIHPTYRFSHIYSHFISNQSSVGLALPLLVPKTKSRTHSECTKKKSLLCS